MRHHYTIRDGRYCLRPAAIADAPFIVKLRTDPQRSRFIHATSPDVTRQEEWMRTYFDRPDDYYFLIENSKTGMPEGTVGIYNCDKVKRIAEWGRWILKPGSKAAVASALMTFDLAFGELGFSALHSSVVVENKTTMEVLEQLGMRRDGMCNDGIRFLISRSDWEELR